MHITVLPTETSEEVDTAAKEWSKHEEEYVNIYEEDAFDYIRRTDRHSYERLLERIPAMAATHCLIKIVKKNGAPSDYELLREYYEPGKP